MGGRPAQEAFRFRYGWNDIPLTPVGDGGDVPLRSCSLLKAAYDSIRNSIYSQQPVLHLPTWGEHGRGMAVHFGDFLSANQDVRLQAELNSLAAFPEHLQHCLVTGPERRCWSLQLLSTASSSVHLRNL